MRERNPLRREIGLGALAACKAVHKGSIPSHASTRAPAMIRIAPLFKYKGPQELMDLAARLVTEYHENGEINVLRDTNLGEEIVSKIAVLYHLMGGLHGELGRKEARIKDLNARLAEIGKELSQIKRQRK